MVFLLVIGAYYGILIAFELHFTVVTKSISQLGILVKTQVTWYILY